MPGIAKEPVFNLITVKELHPTFGAEISGVDFSKEVPDDVFQEILAAITKVCNCLLPICLFSSSHVQPLFLSS